MSSSSSSSTSTSTNLPLAKAAHPVRNYPKFLWWGLGEATNGGLLFYVWMFVLTAIALVGANAWAVQVADGMIVTNMSDHVSWGLYIANFTFTVGVAAGGVMMVIPAYVYHDKKMHDVVIIGEMLAIAAIAMCLLFVVADLGRPERSWHLIPGIGRFNWPLSMSQRGHLGPGPNGPDRSAEDVGGRQQGTNQDDAGKVPVGRVG